MKLAITLISVLSLTSVAHADKKEKAEALFKQGKKLMGDKKYADACAAFEESYQLDPGIGAELNVAKCYEEWGKIGRAFTAYQLAEKLARGDNDPRVEKIHELVVALDGQVPRLTIKLPKDSPKDLKVTLDARPITSFGDPFVVDPGPHTIEYGVGDQRKQKIVPMDRGAENEVTLEITKGMIEASKGGDDKADPVIGGGDTKPKPMKTTSKPVPGRNMRIGAVALGGAGVLAIGISSVMTLSARGKYNDALDMYCGGMTNGCDSMGLQITHDARSTANTATVIFLLGTAAVGGGVALYLLSPKGGAAPADEGSDDDSQASRYLVPAITSTGAGLVYGGRY